MAGWKRGILALGTIVVIEFCERLCYYTFQGTQKAWLQDQGYSSAQSNSLNQIFGLLSYVSCFFGGWLADTSFGRYRTIAVLVFGYTVGCFLAAFATSTSVDSTSLYFVGTMILVALGTGGIKPNVCVFGCDQIDPNQPDAETKQKSFFNYFYLTVNLGACISFGVLATMATDGLPPYIPKDEGFFFTYLIASAAIGLALVFFLSGTPLYRRESFDRTSEDRMLGRFVHRLCEAARNHKMGIPVAVGWSLIPVLIVLACVSAFANEEYITYTSIVLDVVCIACLCLAHRDNAWFGLQDDITQCLECVPALLIGNITFNIQYNTMSSLFYSQACQMDTRVGNTQLNAAFLNLADSLAIIVFTPIFNQCVFPCLKRCTGKEVSLNAKIYSGILFAVGSQLVAAVLEEMRKRSAVLDVQSACAPEVDGEHVHMSDMSVWWMAIPYMMIGIGEILVNPVLQHAAYEGAPASMRSMLQAFNLFAMGGMPNAIAAGISLATKKYTPNNLNDGDLNVVYYINSAIGFVGMILWWAFCRTRPVREALLSGERQRSGSSVLPVLPNAMSAISFRSA